MQVSDVMTREIRLIKQDATLIQAAELMRQHNIGCLPVYSGNQITGMVTDRDLVIRGLAEHLDPGQTHVQDVMTKGVYTCLENQSVEEACRLMEDKQVHRILVLDRDHQPIGIISMQNLALGTHNEHLCYEVMENICRDR